jgi:hypothetical protein
LNRDAEGPRARTEWRGGNREIGSTPRDPRHAGANVPRERSPNTATSDSRVSIVRGKLTVAGRAFRSSRKAASDVSGWRWRSRRGLALRSDLLPEQIPVTEALS